LCGCMLRVAREMFALLPIEHLLVTATADHAISHNEQIEIPVLSVFFPRNEFASIDFEQAHAYELIERFKHRGNFKFARRSEAFQPISPLHAEDLSEHTSARELPSLMSDI
jgi:hypothetical protein